MRRTGTAFFLGDTAFLSDPKFRALQKLLPDSDDFNSAVGAYWIALAAARRNGTPTLDLMMETGSSFLKELCRARLLGEDGFPLGPFEEWAPKSPQVIAGQARAAQAIRDERGRLLPASPSVSSALDTLGELDQPSTPIPSPQISSPVEGGPGGDDLWRLYMGITRATGISPAAMNWLDDLEQSYGVAAAAAMISEEFTKDKKVGTLLSRVGARLGREAAKGEVNVERERRSKGIYERMMARRIEEYGYTHNWHEEWGEKPEGLDNRV